MKYEYAVLIGRFQPIHNAHLELIENGLRIAKKVIVVLGSNRCAPNIRNPWTPQERQGMIELALQQLPLELEVKNVEFITVNDYIYNDMVWLTEVQRKVNEKSNNSKSICLIGSKKDYSSYYISFFNELWDMELSEIKKPYHSSSVRLHYFEGSLDQYFEKDIERLHDILAPGVAQYLKVWRNNEIYTRLKNEAKFVKEYKEKTQIGLYPVQFVTVDCCVICSGHVLVVRRKGQPGKGLLALPGGFVEPTERIENAALRELKEETQIKVNKQILRNSIVDVKYFDHPDRSPRGRIITFAHHIKLNFKKLPEIKASDDAEDAFWLPIGEVFVREDEFHEDHAHIISKFLLGD